MDASHVLVGGLSAITLGLLVWAEIRSRRNKVQIQSDAALHTRADVGPAAHGAAVESLRETRRQGG